MSVNDYTLKIKNIVESLASIGVTIDDDDKVEVCLCGLGPLYKQFKTSIQTRENIPNFQDLCSMLIVEEKNLLCDQDTSTQPAGNSEQQVFYSNTSRGRGRGQSHGRRTGNQNHGQQQQNDSQQYTGGRGQVRGMGIQRGRGNFQRQQSDRRTCYYCGKPEHM